MIELNNNQLIFRFPDVHPEAVATVEFQRTLRIPDDNRDHPLPPGLGRFPLEHVDDFAETLPQQWRQHGGVFLPMYQAEALWVNFSGGYPCAIKVAAGKVNAVSGKAWTNSLAKWPQDYLVAPDQPWLDGFNVAEGYIRQFVAMPLGEGFTAEEQLTGEAEHGGLQIVVYPMKRDVYIRHFEEPENRIPMSQACRSLECLDLDMGLAPGGLMRQKIYEDKYGIDAWDQDHGYRCFVHLANSIAYHTITGRLPPQAPPSAEDYTAAGLPWFDYYSDQTALSGSELLAGLKSVAEKTIEKHGTPMPGNTPVQPKVIAGLGTGRAVRDGNF